MSICQYIRHAINQIYLHLLQPKVYYSPVPKPSKSISYPATDFDTIYTCIINFQDVALQKGLESGPLWCDEGVYRIAKELQLLNPVKFVNIFLGLGTCSFPSWKSCDCFLWEIPRDSGINSIFVELDIFSPEAVTSFTACGNYMCGKSGIALIAEALQRLQFFEFIKTVDISRFCTYSRVTNTI